MLTWSSAVGAVWYGSTLTTWEGDGTAKLWDANSGRLLQSVGGVDHPVVAATFDDSSNSIVTWGKNGSARKWDASSGQITTRFQDDISSSSNVDYTSSMMAILKYADRERILTWSSANKVILWDYRTGEAINVLGDDEYKLLGASLDQETGTIVTWDENGGMRLWNSEFGIEVLRFVSQGKAVVGATIDPARHRILAWSEDGSVSLWYTPFAKQLYSTADPNYDQSSNKHFLSEDKRMLLTLTNAGMPRLWDVESDKRPVDLSEHGGRTLGATFDRAGKRVLTWSADNTLRVWHSDTGEQLAKLEDEGPDLGGAMFDRTGSRVLSWASQRGLSAAGKPDGPVRMWDPVTKQVIRSFEGHTWGVLSAQLNPKGDQLLTVAVNGTGRLWNLSSNDEPITFKDNTPSIDPIFSDSGEFILSVTSDKNCTDVWGVAERKQLRHICAKSDIEDDIEGIAFSPDDSQIIKWNSYYEDATAWLIDVKGDRTDLVLSGHKGRIRGASFHPDLSRIATWATDGTIIIWDRTSGRQIAAMRGHSSSVTGVSFNGDGQLLLSWSLDGSVRVWDTTTGELIVNIVSGKSGVEDASFLRNGTEILVLLEAGNASKWSIADLDLKPIMDRTCFRFGLRSVSEIDKRYGIEIKEPICGPGTPEPNWINGID